MNELYIKLEDLIAEILTEQSIGEVQKAVQLRSSERFSRRYEADIVVSRPDQKIIIEVKSYRSQRIPFSLLKNSLEGLSYLIDISKSAGGILIVTSNIEPKLRAELEQDYDLKVWDRGILFYLTSTYTELRQRLETILLGLLQSGEEDIYDGTVIPSTFSLDQIWYYRRHNYITSFPVNRGFQLCKELEALAKGIESAYAFEDKCEEIVKYLFSDDLTMWERQSRTDDSLHKFDLICKIASKNDFWRVLARDFKSRFVIFEFKNYTEKIKQGQVYSTEKYLYSTALRTIAIVLSREGADKNAILAMNGSLREQGKLIICLDQSEICLMLNKKDSGDDPNSYLSDKIDNILMRLAR